METAYLEYAEWNINSVRAKGRRKRDFCNVSTPLDIRASTKHVFMFRRDTLKERCSEHGPHLENCYGVERLSVRIWTSRTDK